MGKFGEKFGPIGEELLRAIRRKKTETEPDYEGENPATTEEVIEDLKKEGIVKETQEKKPFSEKDAEEIIKAALGKDVFEREEKDIKEKKERRIQKTWYPPHIYQEIKRLTNNLISFKEKFEKAKTEAAKAVYLEKVKFFEEELKKAKAA
jgi:DNA-binding transcriptional regulator YhcF (GntR family)